MNAASRDVLIQLPVHRFDGGTSAVELVDWATEALVNGDDTPALVELAGLPRDSLLSEAGPLLDRALSQLGVDIPEPDELRRAYVTALVLAWDGLDPDDYHTLSDAESEAAARTLAKQWVAR